MPANGRRDFIRRLKVNYPLRLTRLRLLSFVVRQADVSSQLALLTRVSVFPPAAYRRC